MGLITETGNTDMVVYLTHEGRKKLLEQGYVPVSFSLGDTDINYNSGSETDKKTVDLTGDHDDNVFSLAKSVQIKNIIIVE
jgi:hypothetical protein